MTRPSDSVVKDYQEATSLVLFYARIGRFWPLFDGDFRVSSVEA